MEERYQEREEAQQLADMQELQSQLPDVELPEDAETEEPLFPDQQAMTNELPAQEDSEISEPIQVVNFHITDDALGLQKKNSVQTSWLFSCLKNAKVKTVMQQQKNRRFYPGMLVGADCQMLLTKASLPGKPNIWN